MNDIWVCSACKSINRMRDDRCYRCAGRQERAMAPEGPDLRLASAVAERTARAYASSLPIAVLTALLILGVAGLGIVLILLQLQSVPAMRQAFLAAISTGSSAPLDAYALQQLRLVVPSMIRTGLVVLAVLGFGLWLNRVVLNIPALGGGTPRWGPWKALLYPIIPIVNIIKVPGMIQDALYRLDPKAGGFFMVLAAWIGFFGSWLVGIVGGWIITGTAVDSILRAGSIDGAVKAFGTMLDQASVLSVITEVMVATGAVLLVVIMFRIEGRAATRDREIRAAVLGAASGA